MNLGHQGDYPLSRIRIVTFENCTLVVSINIVAHSSEDAPTPHLHLLVRGTRI